MSISLSYFLSLAPRSNFMGTSFTIYDNGISPNKPGTLSDGSNAREEIAACVYVSIVMKL